MIVTNIRTLEKKQWNADDFVSVVAEKEIIEKVLDELKKRCPNDNDIYVSDSSLGGKYAQILVNSSAVGGALENLADSYGKRVEFFGSNYSNWAKLSCEGSEDNCFELNVTTYDDKTAIPIFPIRLLSEGDVPVTIVGFESENVEDAVRLGDIFRCGKYARKVLDYMPYGQITLGFLISLYKSNSERDLRLTASKICKAYKSIDNIKKVIVDEIVYSKQPSPMLAEKMQDTTVLLKIASVVKKVKQRVYDLENSTVTASYIEKALLANKLFDDASNDFIREKCFETLASYKVEGFPQSIVGKGYSDFVFTVNDDGTSTCFCCISDKKDVTIPSVDPTTGGDVVEIGSGCFYGCNTIETISVPSGIKNFNQNSLAGLEKLRNVYVDGKTESLEECENGKLRSVVTLEETYTVPKNIKSVGAKAFAASPHLKTIILQDNVNLLVESLKGCQHLTEIKLGNGVTKLNVVALKNAKIKTLSLANGTSVSIDDEYCYECLEEKNGAVTFSYRKLAEGLNKLDRNCRYKIAKDLLENHFGELGKENIQVVDAVACSYIDKGDLPMLTKLLSDHTDCNIDYAELAVRAKNRKQTKIYEYLQQFSTAKSVQYDAVEALPGPKLYVKIRFDDNTVYSYFCSFKVNVGDKAYVQGKKSGMCGTIEEIIPNMPRGRQGNYVLNVERALNMVRK